MKKGKYKKRKIPRSKEKLKKVVCQDSCELDRNNFASERSS